MSDREPTVVVVGAGYFGCSVALSLANGGYRVVLVERLSRAIDGTSRHNTNRVHQGFHYPRDLNTALECRASYQRFEQEFAPAIRTDFLQLYGVADEGSKTSAPDFLAFCANAGLQFSVIEPDSIPLAVRGCSLMIETTESICDSSVLRRLLTARLAAHPKVSTRFATEVTAIARKAGGFDVDTSAGARLHADAVVNCCYADINRLTQQLGYDVAAHQYESTVIPIIEADLPPVALTVMDGPFMTLFPRPEPSRFLLYHVKHSVLETDVARTLDVSWIDPDTSPWSRVDKPRLFAAMRESCRRFVPELGAAKLVGFLHSTRVVLSNRDDSDARPTIVEDYGEGYLSVFSGKIDRCLDVADAVCTAVERHLGVARHLSADARSSVAPPAEAATIR